VRTSWGSTAIRAGVAQPPVTARIFEGLAFIMATAEEISVIVDDPGASEDEVREVTDALVSVYAPCRRCNASAFTLTRAVGNEE
jgi:hypothetical protein